MNHVDLFSGIGGFALAASWCWGDEYVNVGHSEIEKFPCQVYHKHFPESECLGDITKIEWGGFKGRIDLITGGFPCQPFSVAGKRRGKEDNRFLWHEMLRAVQEIGPRWILAENVPGIESLALDEVLSSLEAEGYTNCEGEEKIIPFVIPACAVNAPHRRDRVWIVAYCRVTRLSESRPKSRNETAKSKIGTQYRDSDASNANRDRTRERHNGDALRPVAGEVRQGGDSQNPQDASADANNRPERDASDSKSLRLEGNGGVRQAIDTENGRQEISDSDDNLSWRQNWLDVATRLCGIHDGVPNRVERHISQDEAMRTMRGYYDSAALGERSTGFDICKEKVLLKQMLWTMDRIAKRESHTSNGPQASAAKSENDGTLREVQFERGTAETSQGSEYREQLIGKLADSLSKLPSMGTHGGWNMGGGSDEKEIQRTGRGIENRVARLKGLGNAIVPQVGFEIMKAIKDHERPEP